MTEKPLDKCWHGIYELIPTVFKAISSINYLEEFLETLLEDYKLPKGKIITEP